MALGRPKRSGNVVRRCEVCGKEMVQPEWERPRRFCSRACFHRPGTHRPSKGTREPERRQCAHCGELFLAGGRGHHKLASRFCSRGCATGATHPFKGGSLQGHNLGTQKAGYERSFSPTLLGIAWAAGIYEGEGTALRRKQGHGHEHVAVTQKEPWILDRLAELFGGRVYLAKGRGPQSINGGPLKDYGDYYRWYIGGARARGFLMTIYSFLSPRRREQARVALGHAPRVVED
jgi:ssDNA-binding Zn-finger/Zn-ribbon topoisomerase 1